MAFFVPGAEMSYDNFDWIRFLESHHIPYETSGPNTARGQIAIHCPLCGAADPSMHMSIALHGGGWRCWRRPDAHYGRSPTGLVRLLILCSDDQAKEIVGGSVYVPDDWLSQVQQQFVPAAEEVTPPLKLPQSFKKLASGLPSAKPFLRYLHDRGFDDRGVEFLAKRFGLHYCTQGLYKGRLIFPIRYGKELVTWTGRTIYKTQNLRYRTLSADPEKAAEEGMGRAIGPITRYLLSFNHLMKSADADTLCICEGPFDSAKVQLLGQKMGITSTCFFTSMPSRDQVELFHLLLPKYKRRFLLLDRGTMPVALKIMTALSGLGVRIMQLPGELKDPGEFTESSFTKFISHHDFFS